LPGRALLNAFLHPQFIIQKMVGKGSGSEIDMIDANAITIPIGAD